MKRWRLNIPGYVCRLSTVFLYLQGHQYANNILILQQFQKSLTAFHILGEYYNPDYHAKVISPSNAIRKIKFTLLIPWGMIFV
jgi:hypothetical protein